MESRPRTVYVSNESGSYEVRAEGIPEPHDLTFDVMGRLFVSGNTTSGAAIVHFVSPWASVTTLPHLFRAPIGLAFDHGGHLDVSNYGAGTISKVTFP